MIHSTETEFATATPKTVRATRSFPRAHHAHEGHARPHIATAGWTSLTFAEPEITSLWDTGLLDRLSSPLTRFHE